MKIYLKIQKKQMNFIIKATRTYIIFYFRKKERKNTFIYNKILLFYKSNILNRNKFSLKLNIKC